jgi:putative endonuclease
MPAKAGISGGENATMRYGGWTYILTNKPRGVLYLGVISDLAVRIW